MTPRAAETNGAKMKEKDESINSLVSGVSEVGRGVKRVGRFFKPTLAKLFYLLVGVVVSLFLLAPHMGWLFAPADTPTAKEAEALSPSIVFSRMKDEGELVTVSYDYSIVDKVTKDNLKLFDRFDIPFTENSYWYRYVGTIKAGVNMKTMDFKQSDDGKVLHVTLDQPYIISNTPDMDKSGVLEEHNNVLNPITVKETDEWRRQCVKMSESTATKGGVLNEAKTNAETQIKRVFDSAFGEDAYKLEFEYRDSSK